MNSKLIAIVCILTALAGSCTNPQKSAQVTVKETDTTHKALPKSAFFDSIMSKSDISKGQLQLHLLDTGVFTSYSRFAGDTVYYPNSDYPLVILSMGFRGVCLEKYLLVYRKNGLKNIACMKVETDCDIDYGTDYDKLDYKVFNKNLFYTRDAWYAVDSDSKVKITTTDQFYQVNANGKIDSLKKKPAGITVPKFIPMDVTDDDK